MSYFSRASAPSFDPLVVVHATADAILAKDRLRGKLKDSAASVKVSFPNGTITEW
jgi:hypothetical protein